MINVPFKGVFNLKNYPLIINAINEAESELKEKGRILLRPSGTEPLVRIMVEGEDPYLVEKIAKRVAGVVEAEAKISCREL
jgi:phosphoglucosamine mutase